MSSTMTEGSESPREASPYDVPTTLDSGPAPRNLGLLDQLGMWGNLGISLLGFAGALVVLQPLGAPGMGLVPAITALVAGTLVGTAGVSAMAFAGSQQGQPAMVLLRGLFGGRLSYVPTTCNIIQLTGWGTFEIVTTAMAVRTLWPSLPHWPVIVVVGALSTLLALYPLHWVKVLRKYVTSAVVVVLIYYAVRLGTHSVPTWHGHGWNGFMLAVDAIVGLSTSWVPVAGDYARHSMTHRAAVVGSFLGYSVTQIAVYVLGIITLVLAHGDGGGVFGILMGLTAGTVCFAILSIREIDQCFVDVYSTTVSIQNLRPGWDRRVISVTLGVLSTVLALAVNIENFASFLSLIGSVFVPLLGVFLVDYYGFRRGRTWDNDVDAPGRPLMFLPWVVGFMAYEMVSPGELGWWSRLWTHLDDALSFTPPTWMSASITSFVVAALVTALVERFSRGTSSAGRSQ